MANKEDRYQGVDYYNIDDLLTEEHILIRDSARAWAKQEVSPIIEDAYEKAVFPKQWIKGLGEIGAFGPYIPEEYGGPGLDQISYGLLMQELERGDSGPSVYSVGSEFTSYVSHLEIWFRGAEAQVFTKARNRRNDGLFWLDRT